MLLKKAPDVRGKHPDEASSLLEYFTITDPYHVEDWEFQKEMNRNGFPNLSQIREMEKMDFELVFNAFSKDKDPDDSKSNVLFQWGTWVGPNLACDDPRNGFNLLEMSFQIWLEEDGTWSWTCFLTVDGTDSLEDVQCISRCGKFEHPTDCAKEAVGAMKRSMQAVMEALPKLPDY